MDWTSMLARMYTRWAEGHGRLAGALPLPPVPPTRSSWTGLRSL